MALSQPSVVTLLILSSYIYLLNVFGWIFDRFCHAGLIGETVLGIIYGTPLAGLLTLEWEDTFWSLGYIGLVLIVFEGGLHTDIVILKANLVLSTIIAVIGAASSMGLSFVFLSLACGLSYIDGVVGGAALAATSLGTTFSVLLSDAQRAGSTQKDIRQTRIGSTLISAALIDDIIGLILASLVPRIRSASGNSSRAIILAVIRPVAVSLFIFALVCNDPVRRFTKAGLASATRRLQSRTSVAMKAMLLIILMLLSGVTTAASYAGASPLLGAWAAGIVLSDLNGRSSCSEDTPTNLDESAPTPEPPTFREIYELYIAPLQSVLLAPMFFGSIGSAIPFLSLWKRDIAWKGILFSLLMVFAKLLCGLCVIFWPGRLPGTNITITAYPALFLASAMISRGEISLLIMQIGGLSDAASAIVTWAVLLCTIVGPIATGMLLRLKRAKCVAGNWG